MKEWIVYRTENKKNGKFYYGVHNGSRPNYIGSGVALKRAVKLYGVENFVRRTIAKFATEEEAYNFEALLVDEDMIKLASCYNAKPGGYGGGPQSHSEKSKRLISKILMGNTRAKGRIPHNVKMVMSDTGIFYNSVTEAAETLDVDRRTLNRWLNGEFPNKSNLRYV